MKTTAVRIYGKNDLRMESFELPPIKGDEILAKVVSDSICMSSYKAAIQGGDHKRVPNDIAQHPTIIGHELCGELVEIGGKWRDRYRPGQRFSVQPTHNKNGSLEAPGYSYEYCGGDATYMILPPEIMEMDCLLTFDSDCYFPGSLAEPMSCIIGAFHASYHRAPGSYVHDMGIRKNGNMALLAGAGPMGLGTIDYALHNPDKRPSQLVVTEIDDARLSRAAAIFTPEKAAESGITLKYLNTRDIDATAELMRLSGGAGYDDVFVMTPVSSVVRQADAVLAKDGCLNFFAGPSDRNFKAELNFYNVHYNQAHIAGTSGGNNDDMREALALMAKGIINPTVMVTHIGGLDSVVRTTLDLPHIPGGKKLIYTGLSLELTAISDFAEKGKTDPLFRELARIVGKTHNLWNGEAESYLLSHARPID